MLKIFSGMIEHVGHEFIEEFFISCESALAQNGFLVLQVINTQPLHVYIHMDSISIN